VTLETEEDIVTELRLKYFDTVPVAASMSVLRTGFLFVASEFGNHHLYQITRLGEDDDEPEFSSAEPLEEGETFFFTPRGLRNLVLTDEMDSLSPVLTPFFLGGLGRLYRLAENFPQTLSLKFQICGIYRSFFL